MALIIVYTTFENKREADNIISELIRKKLAGCINTFPVKGMYLWKGKIEDDDEIAAIIKTTDKNSSKVERYLEKNHPADIPCILKFRVKSNKSFESWIKKTLD